MSGLGSLALSRHRFRDGARARRAGRAPSHPTARSYGVIGDAQVELGRYREAFRDFDTMNKLRPSLSSYARVSYGRELIGHTARRDPRDEARRRRRHRRRRADRVDARPARQALLQPRPLRGGRARVPAGAPGLPRLRRTGSTRSRRRSGRARTLPRRRSRLERQAVDAIPLPQYVAALGDLYRVTGRPRARAAPVRADRRDRAAAARERRPDRPRDRALPGRPRDRAPARARARAARPAPSGPRSTATTCSPGRSRGTAAAPRRCRYSQRALRLGTQDALKFFHRGDDRALPRPRRAARSVVRAGARAEPALLAALGARREEVRGMKRLTLVLVGRRRSRCRAARGAGAPARQLHDQPLQPRSSVSGNRALRPLRPRPGRDPDVPGEAAGGSDGEARTRPRLAGRSARHLELTVDGRRARARRRSATCSPSRRARPGCARPGSRSSSRGPRAVGDERGRLPRRQLRRAGSAGRRSSSRPTAGARLLSSSAPAKSVSDELLAYPKNLLQSPLDVDSARVGVDPGVSPGAPPTLLPRTRARPARRRAGGRRRRVREPDRARPPDASASSLLSLLIAMFWGAAHAFSPGHGKSIVAAYLVGSRGTPRHAVYLGLTVTVTHTIGVFALGLVTLSLSAVHRPRPAVPVAEPRLGAPDRRRRRERAALARPRSGAAAADTSTTTATRTTTATATITTSTTTRSAAAGCSGSGSRAGSSRARPRSSSCSQRSRSTGSATGSS